MSSSISICIQAMIPETLKPQISVYGGMTKDDSVEGMRKELFKYLITDQLRTWKLATKETDLADKARSLNTSEF